MEPIIKEKTPMDNKAVFKQYKKLMDQKSLPDFWQKKYQLIYARLRKYYKITATLTNPMFDIILEKTAYYTAKLRYMESNDFAESGYDVNDPSSIILMSNMVQTLMKSCEQAMKYSETMKKSSTSKSFDVKIKAISQLSDKELNERLRGIVGGSEENPAFSD
jgi:hypothetical protein